MILNNYLSSNLVAALSRLYVHNFPHDDRKRPSSFTSSEDVTENCFKGARQKKGGQNDKPREKSQL